MPPFDKIELAAQMAAAICTGLLASFRGDWYEYRAAIIDDSVDYAFEILGKVEAKIPTP